MHFPFTTGQVLWTLTFAAQLTLLVVLLGRDRIKRYPWFTISIVLFALRLLVEVLLSGRLAPPVLRVIFITLADMMALVGLLVVMEVARRAFGGVPRRKWVMWTVALVAVAGGVMALWGPWPAWKDLTRDAPLAVLRVMQFLAQKADLMMDLLAVELGVLVVLFGRYYKAGWRSHTQSISIGLSTVAFSWLMVQGVWQIVATSVHPHSQAEYERIVGLGAKLVNANKVVYIAALVWWIVCLWPDEPGIASPDVMAEPVELSSVEEPPQLTQ